MKLVLVVPGGGSGEFRAFHLAAGVDDVAEVGEAADWVIEGAAGEYWWPRGGSLKEILERVPHEYGMVEAVVRRLVAPAGGDPVYRLVPKAPAPGVEPDRRSVRRGGGPQRTLRGWYPIEVLKVERETLSTVDVERGLADGTLVEDARLVDALRTVAAGGSLSFPRPSLVDDAQLAGDLGVLGEAEVVRAQRRLDELEERLAAIESLTPLRLERRLRTFVRRRR